MQKLIAEMPALESFWKGINFDSGKKTTHCERNVQVFTTSIIQMYDAYELVAPLSINSNKNDDMISSSLSAQLCAITVHNSREQIPRRSYEINDQKKDRHSAEQTHVARQNRATEPRLRAL